MPTLKPVEAMQTCDLCGRLVVPGQVMCPCGARVNAPAAAAAPADGRDLTWLLWAVPVAGLVWVIYRIIVPGDMLFSFMPLFKIYAVVAIASAATAAVLADRAARAQQAGAAVGLPPVGWFFAVLLVWPLAFPVFVWNQLQTNWPGKARLALGAAGLFFVAFLWANFVTRRESPAKYFPASRSQTTNPSAPTRPIRPAAGVLVPPDRAPAQQPAGGPSPASPPSAAVPTAGPARAAGAPSAIATVAPQARPQSQASSGSRGGQPNEESYGVEILKKK